MRGECDLEDGTTRSTNPMRLTVSDMPTAVRRFLLQQMPNVEPPEKPFYIIGNILGQLGSR